MFANIDRMARSAHQAGIKGRRSGLNFAKTQGWSGIFGQSMLKKGLGRAQRISAQMGKNMAKKKPNWKRVQDHAWKAAGMAGTGAMRYFGASDFAGETMLKRGAVSGARLGAAIGASAVADFLNPFGFGSIAD